MEPLLVADNLDAHRQSSTMIPTLKHLAKRALAQSINNLIAVCKVVVLDDKIIAALIVIAIVVRRIIQSGHVLLASLSNIIYSLKVHHLLALKFTQVAALRRRKQI